MLTIGVRCCWNHHQDVHSHNFADLNPSFKNSICGWSLTWYQTLQGLYLSGMTPCKNLTEFETRQVGRQFGGTGLMVAVYKPTIRYEFIY